TPAVGRVRVLHLVRKTVQHRAEVRVVVRTAPQEVRADRLPFLVHGSGRVRRAEIPGRERAPVLGVYGDLAPEDARPESFARAWSLVVLLAWLGELRQRRGLCLGRRRIGLGRGSSCVLVRGDRLRRGALLGFARW